MDRTTARVKHASPTPANCNKPISWRLEDNGLTPPLVAGLAELLSCAASYAHNKADRRDLQGSAAMAFDVANRMRAVQSEPHTARVGT